MFEGVWEDVYIYIYNIITAVCQMARVHGQHGFVAKVVALFMAIYAAKKKKFIKR